MLVQETLYQKSCILVMNLLCGLMPITSGCVCLYFLNVLVMFSSLNCCCTQP